MDMDKIALEARRMVVKISADAKAPHAGSCLSVSDILVSLYFDVFKEELKPSNFSKEGRPRIILSKGHAVAAMYAVLHMKGFITKEQLFSYHKNGGLPAHVDTGTPGVEFSTGSLGHGLAVGAGMALAARMDKKKRATIVIMGDGECEEGEVWEAANFAYANGLGNLVAMVDSNNLQAYERTEKLGPRLAEKWAGFGWNVLACDGHDFKALGKTIREALNSGKPSVIIAKTVKSKGIQPMEGRLESHYRSPKGDELGELIENGCYE